MCCDTEHDGATKTVQEQDICIYKKINDVTKKKIKDAKEIYFEERFI